MSRTPPARRAFWLEQLALASVCALLGVLKLQNAFVWDDLALLVQSDVLYDLRNIPVVFANDAMFASDGGAFARVAQLDTYRPFTLLTFMLDGAIWGKQPLGFHLTNLALHIATVALLYTLLLERVGAQRRRIAGWLAAVFALHPLLTEAHVWINGRSDVLATLLVLVAVFAWRRAHVAERTRRARVALEVACGLAFLAAALSKEVAITVLPALALSAFYDAPPGSRVSRAVWLAARRVLPFAIAAGLYLAARVAVLAGLKTHAGAAHAELALSRAGFLLWDGAVRALVPTQISLRYLREDYAALGGMTLAAAWLLTALAALWALRYAKRDAGPLWGMVWYAAVLAPASLISGLQWYGFGRYLYMPLAGLLLGCAPALARAAELGLSRPRLKRLLVAASVAYVLLLGLSSVRATLQWRDQLDLYLAIVVEQPNRSHGYGGLGKWLIERGRPREAIAPLERALSLAPDDVRYYTNLGNAYLMSGRTADAARIAQTGTQRFPTHASLWRLRARAAAARDDVMGAMSAALEGLRLEPQTGASRALLGELLAHGPRPADYARALDQLLATPEYAALASELRAKLEPAAHRH